MSAILRITAKRHGFRRAGIAHPATPVDHPAGRFTAAQIAALKAEPYLSVEEIEEIEEDGPAAPKTAARGKAGK